MSQKLMVFGIFCTVIVGVLLGISILGNQYPPFEKLSAEGMHQKIIAQRDFAIQKATDSGNYKCCIKPPCTMCYMEANPWNNFKAGTCACDDLIAEGKDPCPQCINGLCENEREGLCEL